MWSDEVRIRIWCMPGETNNRLTSKSKVKHDKNNLSLGEFSEARISNLYKINRIMDNIQQILFLTCLGKNTIRLSMSSVVFFPHSYPLKTEHRPEHTCQESSTVKHCN